MFGWIRLGIVGGILTLALGGYFIVDNYIDKHNETIAEMAKLEEREKRLLEQLESGVKTIEDMRLREIQVSALNRRRESIIVVAKEQQKGREQIIEDNKNEECVMAPVPQPVADGLLSYAKERNNSRDQGSDR